MITLKTQYSKVLAVLMAVAMVLSMFCFTAFAQDTDAPAVDTDVVATMDEATADETTADETTADETTTDETTQDETTTDEATEDEVLGLLGDTDLSGSVNVKDATLIQKAIAGLATLDEVQTILADTFADGNVNVKDATEIQKAIAGLPANALIGTPVYGAVEAPEATDDEIATGDEVATDDEVVATDDEVITTDDEVIATDDEATDDETTEPVVETKFYIVGYINGVDYYDYDYEIVDGTITLELTSDSYVLVKDEFGVEYWTNGWLDFNPTSAVLGSYASNDKFHVAAGTVTLTWDAETFTLTKA